MLDEEAAPHEKSPKTEGSRRLIPIHHRVLALGFQRHVTALRGFERPLLFPDLKPNKFDEITRDASHRADRHISEVASDDPRLVFHSLRPRFEEEGREADLRERVLDQLRRHAPTSIGKRDGDGVGMESLKCDLDKLTCAKIHRSS